MRTSGGGSARSLTVILPILSEVVGLERGPLNHVSTIEELLRRESSGFGLEIREYGRKNPLR
jgi:hypothetical protein